MKADHEAKFSQEDYAVPENILEKVLDQHYAAINGIKGDTEKIIEMLSSGIFPLQPRLEDLSHNIAGILKKTEADNVGIKFDARFTSDGIVTITVIPTLEANNFEIGKIVFPNTLQGQVGKQKFIAAMEKGESVHFEADEYQWNFNISLPLSILEFRELSLMRNVPDIKIPVRLVLLKDDKFSVTVNITYMSLVRLGTKEIELKIEGGQLIGEIRLVSDLQDNNTIFTYNGDLLSNLNPVKAKELLLVYEALLQKARFKIIALETEQVLLEELGKNVSSNLDKNYLDINTKFIDILIRINKELHLNLRLPESINKDLFKLALDLDNIFSNGKLTLGSGEAAFAYEKSKAFSFMEVMKSIYSAETKSSQILQMRHEVSFDFLEQKIFLGEAILIFTNVLLVKSIQEIEQEISLLSDGEEIDILLKYDKAIRYFPKWFSDKNDEYGEMVMQWL